MLICVLGWLVDTVNMGWAWLVCVGSVMQQQRGDGKSTPKVPQLVIELRNRPPTVKPDTMHPLTYKTSAN